MKSGISARNAGRLVAVTALAGTIGYGGGQDSWIALIVSAAAVLPLILVYSRIAALFPERGLFDIFRELFGKVGDFIVFSVSIAALLVCSLTVRDLTDYTAAIALDRTPPLLIMASILLVAAYLASSEIMNLGKWASVVIIMAAVSIVLTGAMSAGNINLSYLRPFASANAGAFIQDALVYAASAFGDSIFVLALIGDMKGEESPYRVYLTGTAAGFTLAFIVTLLNVLILGPGLSVQFPSYAAARLIRVKGFIEHIETLVSFTAYLIGITKAALCLRTAVSGMAALFDAWDERKILFPASLAALFIGIGLMGVERAELLLSYCRYSICLYVLTALLLWLSGEFKRIKD